MSDCTKQMTTNDHIDSGSVYSVKISIKHRRTGEFIARKSLLTDLFQISHINCIRNAFIAGFILMILRQTINDFIHYGRLNWTFELLLLTVGKLHIVIIVWCLMTLFTSFVVFYSTYIWASNRKYAGFYLRLYDIIWLGIYVCYLTGLLIIPCWQIIKHQLPIVSSVIILAEQLRQLMKTHSFVRENVEKIIQKSNNSTDRQLSIEFSHLNQYFYFLFAPTLLYRDNYPRTSVIQWNIVLQMFGQFIIILVLVYHVITNFWMPIFTRFFTNDEIPFEVTISTIFDLMLPGVLIVILAFYGFFHCWLNGFAELLRFADRMFYEDWWNLTSAATFWRSWNVVVHDWLYVYVYKDLSKLFNGNRKLSTTCVVILSAIFHEYIMIITLGFFSPIIMAWFGLFGMLFRFAFPRAKGMQWNIVLLTFVPICGALIPYLYVLEVSARYFPSKRKTFWNMIFNSDKQSRYEFCNKKISLHRIYHPPNAFSTADKQGLAERITALYTAVGLPAFYVSVIFVSTEKDSFFVGNQAKDKYIRIVIQHLATQLRNAETNKTIIEKYEKAISPFIKEKGYEWGEIPNETWKLNGLTPPPPNSVTEKDWIRYKKIIPYN